MSYKSCRYGDNLEAVLKAEKATVIIDGSEAGYQGYVRVFAKKPDGSYILAEYSYGSCSGCDTWEAKAYTAEEIQGEIARSLGRYNDKRALFRYLTMREQQVNDPDEQWDIPGLRRELEVENVTYTPATERGNAFHN